MNYVEMLLGLFEDAIRRLNEGDLEPGDDDVLAGFRLLVLNHLDQEEAYKLLLKAGKI